MYQQDHKHCQPGYSYALLDSVRGMMLGLMLGDVRNSSATRLESGALTQLMCFTADALIRQEIANDVAGARTAPTAQLQQALVRWGAMQGQPGPRPAEVDGWLSRVSLLAERRASSPGTEQVLQRLADGVALSAENGIEADGMLRSIPVATLSLLVPVSEVSGWCRGSATLTQGHPDTWSAGALLGTLVGTHLEQTYHRGAANLDPIGALQQLMQVGDLGDLQERLFPLLADHAGFRPSRLAELSGDASANSVLLGGLYLWRTCRECTPTQIRPMAQAAYEPAQVAALAGSLLGLEQGSEWLDFDEISRHELAWVVDRLAQDLTMAVLSSPWGSSPNTDCPDDSWIVRYPPLLPSIDQPR